MKAKQVCICFLHFAGRDSFEGTWSCHYMKFYLLRVLHLGNVGLPGEFELTGSSSLSSYILGFGR